MPEEEVDLSQKCNKQVPLDSDRFHRTHKKLPCHFCLTTPLQTQSSSFLVFKQAVDFQLHPRFLFHKQISAPLQPVLAVSHSQAYLYWHGRGFPPQNQEKKTMRPASFSSTPPSASSSSDTSTNSLAEAPKKVVVRGLPPSLSETEFRDTIIRFEQYFNWVSFCPGKVSLRKSRNSRAYIYFIHSADIFKFYEQFNGQVFVSVRGTQYKALVQYAPHQKVPRLSLEADNEEGSLLADPEYSEFVSGLAKPVEFLPSAEVQLERREAEKRSAGIAKETTIITPLMQYVREKRALKEKTSQASRKQISGPRNSAVSYSKVLPKGVPDITRDYSKYASKTSRPTEKSTYIPCSFPKPSDCKDSVSDPMRATVAEAKCGPLTTERSLGNSRHGEQNDNKDLGTSRHSEGRSVRNECKPHHTDSAKRSKNMSSFRGPQKQVWVAKPASRT